MSGIRIDSLGTEIAKMMEEYASEVAADTKAEARAVAKETVKELKRHPRMGLGAGRDIIRMDGPQRWNRKMPYP